jgi:hypothetical protein
MIAAGDVLAFASWRGSADYEDARLRSSCAAGALRDDAASAGANGQTSSYSRCRWAQPKRLRRTAQSAGPVRHKLLERFGSVLFPEEPTPDLTVFKDAEPAAATEALVEQP